MGERKTASLTPMDTTSPSAQASKICFSILEYLETARSVTLHVDQCGRSPSGATIGFESGVLSTISELSALLEHSGKTLEADALQNALFKCTDAREFGGLGFAGTTSFTEAEQSEILFQVQAWIEALNSAERAKATRTPIATLSEQAMPMTLAQKIFAQHSL